MTLDALAGRLSPDISQTFRRFPFAILLTGLATLALIANMTELVTGNQDMWARIVIGLATAAIFATGGALFAENHPKRLVLGIIVAYVVPLAALAALQVTNTTWIFPWALPAIGSLWTSVSASTAGWRGSAREEAQNRYWWLNHLAIASGAIVGVAYLIVLIGTFAIGQTLDVLFGLDATTPLYKVALPAIGGFFAPLYWLSTLPRAADYQPGRLEAPDFLIRAVAMIGKFILIPLLLAYAAILLVYAAQIVLTQQLPEGTIGWMVLGFVTTGAGAWLVLHPEILRDSMIVRFFRRWWFWATIVPLVLYFVAVQVRIDAYGFTPERLLLVWGGVWATAVTVLFLLRRGDIRLIPGIAALCLLLATVGPWNIVGLSRTQQSATFDNLLPLTGPNGESYGITPDWTPAETAKAYSTLNFLLESDEGREAVRTVLHYKGFDLAAGYFGPVDVMMAIGVVPPGPVATSSGYIYPTRASDSVIDVSATPNFLGTFRFAGSSPVQAGPLSLAIYDTYVTVLPGPPAEDAIRADLKAWVAQQRGDQPIVDPVIDFTSGGVAYRFVVDSVEIASGRSGAEEPNILSISGLLFSATPPAPAPAAEPPPTAPAQPTPAT